MILPTPTIKACLVRHDSCSSAEIKTHLFQGGKSSGPAEAVVRQKRRLVFNEQVIVRTMEHINDKTEAEIRATWYKKSEYQMMRAAFAVTIRKILAGNYKGDCENHCARGIEFRTPEGSQRRKMNKLNALVAVLDEQERQRDEEDENSTALACVYVHSNHASRNEAQKFGDLDAEEALRVYSGQESLTVILQQEALEEDDDDDQCFDKTKNVGVRIGRIFKRKDSKQKPTRSRSPERQ